MKLVNQLIGLTIAFIVLATVVVPIVNNVAPHEEGEGTLEGKNDGFDRYAKIENFSVVTTSTEGETPVYTLTLTTTEIPGYSWEIPTGDGGYVLGNKFQFYNYLKSGKNYPAIMIYGDPTPTSENYPIELSYDKSTDTLTYKTNSATKTATVEDAYIYVPYATGAYVRSDGTDGAVFNMDVTTIDGGYVGGSPRGFVQIIDGTLTKSFFGGNSGQGTFVASPFALTEHVNKTTLMEISDNTITYTAATEGSTSGPWTLNMWFMPYEYSYEGEYEDTPLVGKLVLILPILMAVGIMLGASKMFTTRTYRE